MEKYNFLMQLYMTDFFMVKILFESFRRQATRFLDVLTNIYLLDKVEADRLRMIAESEELCDIRTQNDYCRYKRAEKYLGMIGKSMPYDELRVAVVNAKGKAFSLLRPDLCGVGNSSEAYDVMQALFDCAEKGDVASMRISGLALIIGETTMCNKNRGKGYLKKAAMWNSVEAMLYSLYFGVGEKKVHISTIKTVLTNKATQSVGDTLVRISSAYGRACCEPDKETYLLEELFSKGLADRGYRSEPYDRVLRSRIISVQDKKKILSRGDDRFVASVANLPLYPVSAEDISIKGELLRDIPFKNEEVAKLKQLLLNADMCNKKGYKPICISSKSVLLAKTYAEAISESIENVHVTTWDMSEFPGGRDLGDALSVANVCDDRKTNVIVMCFGANTDEKVMAAAIRFLDAEERKRSILYASGICIGLSDILPICVCTAGKTGKLGKYCNVIDIAQPDKNERKEVVEYLIGKKEEEYGLPSISVENGALERLLSLDVDEINNLLDKTITANRRRGESLYLCEKDFTTGKASGANVHRFGFGGYTDENQ